MHTSSYINIFSYTKYIGIGTTYIWYALNDIGFRVVDSVDSWSFGTRELWGVKPASIGITINTCNLDLNCIICPNESKWNKWIQMVQWSQLTLHSFSRGGWDCWDWDPQNQRFWIIAGTDPKAPHRELLDDRVGKKWPVFICFHLFMVPEALCFDTTATAHFFLQWRDWRFHRPFIGKTGGNFLTAGFADYSLMQF